MSETTVPHEKPTTTAYNYDKNVSNSALNTNEQSTDKPKHFFSPIRKKNNPQHDVLITTELGNSSSHGKSNNTTEEAIMPSSPSFQVTLQANMHKYNF